VSTVANPSPPFAGAAVDTTPGPRRAPGFRYAAFAFAAFCAIAFAAVLFRGEILLPFHFQYALDPVFGGAAPDGWQARVGGLTVAWDRVYQFHPWTAFTVASLRAGDFPLWNPLLAGGTPHLALDQTAVLDPLSTGAGLIVGAPRAWTAQAVLAALVAGLGVLLFARRRDMPAAGALLAALAFAFGGWMLAWMGRPMVSAACWLPLLLYAVDGVRAGPRPARSALLAAVVTALSFFGGHVETTAHVLLLASAFALFHPSGDGDAADRPTRRRLSAVAAMLAGAIVAAPLLIPVAELLFRDGGAGPRLAAPLGFFGHLRAGLAGGFSIQSIGSLLTAVVPVMDPGGTLPLSHPAPNLPEATLYVGVVPLLLAAYGLRHRIDPRAQRFWAVVASVGLLMALRVPVADLLNQLPLIHLTAIGRLRLVYGFATAMLAGHGLASLQARATEIRANRWSIAALLLALAAAVAFQQLGSGRAATAAVTGLACGAAWLLAVPRLSRRALVPVTIALAALDLGLAMRWMQPSAPAGEVYPPTPVTSFLASHPGRIATRALAGGKPLMGAAPLEYGLATAEGYDVLYPARYRMLWNAVNGTQAASNASDYLLFGAAGSPLVDLFGIRWLVTGTASSPQQVAESGIPRQFPRVVFSDGQALVWENPDPLPPAVLIHRVMKARSAEDALAMVTADGFDPHRTAVVEGAGSAEGRAAGADTLAYRRPSSGRLVVRTASAAAGLLLVNSAYDRGWRATVDGTEAPVHPADVAFMGIEIPAGRHRVQMRYAPGGFRLGWMLSCLTLAAMLAAAAWERKRAWSR
jgi:hypothetical protein